MDNCYSYYKQENNDYRCIECNKSIKKYKNSSSNLISHLKYKHSDIFNYTADMSLVKVYETNNKIENENNKDLNNNINQNLIMVKAFCKSNYPINIFESSFLKTFNYYYFPSIKIPCIKTMKKEMILIYEKAFAEIINDVKWSKYYSLSADIWSNDNKIILSLLIKYMKKNIFKTKILVIKDIEDQKATTISTFIWNLLKENDLDYLKLVSITLDNCPSMKLTEHLLKELIINENSDYIDEIITNDKILFKENKDIHLNDTLDNMKKCSNLKYVGCKIHLLQLVIKKSLINFEEYYKLIKQLIKIALFFKKKKYKNQLLFVPIPFDIRWNTYYMFLKSFLNNYESYKKLENDLPIELLNVFKNIDKAILDFLTKLLEQFYYLSKKLECNNFNIFEFSYLLEKITENFKNYINLNENIINQKFIIDIITNINFYFFSNDEKLNEHYTYLYFHEKGFNKLDLQKKENIRQKITLIYEENKNIEKLKNSMKNKTDKKKIKLKTFNEDKQKLKNYFSLESEDDKLMIVNENDIKEEIDFYEKIIHKKINMNLMFKRYQNKIPFLYDFYEKNLYYFASNGPIERSFSSVTLLLDDKKNRTNTKTIEMRLFLKEYFKD